MYSMYLTVSVYKSVQFKVVIILTERIDQRFRHLQQLRFSFNEDAAIVYLEPAKEESKLNCEEERVEQV